MNLPINISYKILSYLNALDSFTFMQFDESILTKNNEIKKIVEELSTIYNFVKNLSEEYKNFIKIDNQIANTKKYFILNNTKFIYDKKIIDKLNLFIVPDNRHMTDTKKSQDSQPFYKL